MTTSDTFHHKDYWGGALGSCVPLGQTSKFQVYYKDYWGGALASCAPVGHTSTFQVYFLRNPVKTYINNMYFFKLAFTPRKDGQPLQGITLQEKEV